MAEESEEQQRPIPGYTIEYRVQLSVDRATADLLRDLVAGPVNQQLNRIERKLGVVQEQGEAIMADIAQLETAVAEETSVQRSAITLLENLSQMVKDAGTDPVKLQAVVDQINSNKSALAAAVTANTPAAGEPPVA